VGLRLYANAVIRAPQDRIFEIIATPERLPEWNVSVELARRAAPGEPVCLGSRAIFTGRLLGQPLESETEVIEYQPPCVFVTRAIRGPRLTTRFELESIDQTTRVYVDVSGDVPGGIIGQRLAEGFLRKELTASLDRLRILGEADRQ
jgi:uncharacterized protein YndB with AHSA1/START domain